MLNTPKQKKPCDRDEGDGIVGGNPVRKLQPGPKFAPVSGKPNI
ncbi:MAG: hypothetical protein WCD70_14420 [Alphaproteobacteria bacterium]